MQTIAESDIQIRRAKHCDCGEVSVLLKKADLPISDIDPQLEGFWVASNNGSIVGTVAIERFGKIGLLRSLAVTSSHRGRQIGSKLYQEALSTAKSDGVEQLYLLTTTAAEYFGKRGFARISRQEAPPEIQAHEQFTSLCPSSATIMRKSL